MWTQFKELYRVVENSVLKQQVELLSDLEAVLKKHRPDFIALLKNPAKNAEHRNLLQKAAREPVVFPGSTKPRMISSSIAEEATIISDMYNLNELVTLQLIETAEHQMQFYPDLTRGLVAVLLYYDARRSLVNSLKVLVQARKGVSWSAEGNAGIIDYITEYTDKLLEKGLVDKILTLLEELNLEKEISLLEENRALGGPRHRRQVMDFFKEIRQSLMDILFCWAAQNGLDKEDAIRLLDHLSGLETVNPSVPLLFAFLYSIDVSPVIRSNEDEEIVQNLPVVADATFVPSLHKELVEKKDWKNKGLLAACQFAWAMSLSSFRGLSSSLVAPVQNYVDEDEAILDMALEEKAFKFLVDLLENNETIFKEEFYLRRLHSLVTDLIIQMPLKIKDLRNQADEVARTVLAYQQEGLEPPQNLPLHFQNLLGLVTVLYSQDPLNLELSLDYWTSEQTRSMALYKFVRLAGDLLPPTLYIAYTNMLSSLANGKRSANQAFALLRQNSSSQGNIVSWDHFFSSLQRYHQNLRQEALPVPDTIYRHKPLTKGITPQEVLGLQAVLKLTRTVALQDPVARIALAENPAWQPTYVIIGLLGCAVPLLLKAELMETLVAFAKSPEIAHVLWEHIEAAQILATTSLNVSGNSRGIQTELEEVEARAEEFPLTRAFLDLLDVLTDVPIPNIGAGTRVPGFDPYLVYIRDRVFLRFGSRVYRNAAEKWQVGSLCLKLFLKLLASYTPAMTDLEDNYGEPRTGTTGQSKPPGYHILLHCLNETNFLQLILSIVDESSLVLEQYTTTQGQSYLELCALYSLLILKNVLLKEELLMELVRKRGAPLRVTSLETLLLGVNSRTGRADHLLSLTKFVSLNQLLPQHSLAALQVIRQVALAPGSQQQLVSLFSSPRSAAVLSGFVESLDAEDDLLTEEEEGEPSDSYLSPCPARQSKKTLLKLLLEGVALPQPSLAQVLIGFSPNVPLKRSQLQQPGIQGQVRTCLHSVLDLLENHLTPGERHGTQLTDLGYQLIYRLAIHPEVSDNILRFLRSCNNFVPRHVGLMSPDAHGLSPISWLLKTAAVEIKVASDKGLQSQLAKMTTLFAGTGDIGIAETGERNAASSWLNASSLVTTISSARPNVKAKSKLMALLDGISLQGSELKAPDMEFFDAAAVENLLKEHEVPSEANIPLVKVRQLQQRLQAELAAIPNVALGQRQLIIQEIKNILAYATNRNKTRLDLAARRSFLEGWRQVVEVLLAAASPEVFPFTDRWNFVLELSQDLLNKVLEENNLPGLVNFLSGVLVSLTNGLRVCAVNMAASEVSLAEESELSRNLDGSIGWSRAVGGASGDGHAPLGTLYSMQRRIIEWILSTNGAVQRVRVNLYSALLIGLRVKGGASSGQWEGELLKNYQSGLLTVLARDCSSGHDVQRMLALSLLNQFALRDHQMLVASFLYSQGYLRHLVESLLLFDGGLNAALEPQPVLKTLYVYESQMALLISLASSERGAKLLLETHVFKRLGELTVFSQRPETTAEAADSLQFLPDVVQRFNQILFPALQLCSTVLSTLGHSHRAASSEILKFLLSHSDTVSVILRHRRMSNLEEVALLLSAIPHVLGSEILSESSESLSVLELQGQLSRLENLALSLLPVYGASEDLWQTVAANEMRSCLQIQLSVLQLATAVTSENRLVFAPSFERTNGKQLSLGVLVKLLNNACGLLATLRDNQTRCQQRLRNIPQWTVQQLAENFPAESDKTLPVAVRKVIALRNTQKETEQWKRLLELARTIVETATWLLWKHLEQYVKAAGPGLGKDTSLVKQDAAKFVDAALFKKLEDSEEVYVDKGRHRFVQALIRRMKRLLSV